MDSVPCPGCSAPLGLDQEVCGRCRRPRDEREIERGHEFVRESARLKARRPYMAAAWAAAAAAVALAVHFRAPLLGRAAAERDDLARQLEEAQNPGKTGERADHSPTAATVVAAAGLIKTLSAASAPAPVPAPAPPAPAPPAVVTLPTPPRPGDPDERVFYGVVYDLLTAAPLSDVVMEFSLATKPPLLLARIKTDPEGHYVVRLSRNYRTSDPILVSIAAPGYRDGQLEDPDPPYYSRTPEERGRVAAETTERDLDPVPLLYNSADDAVLLNLALVPDRAGDAR